MTKTLVALIAWCLTASTAPAQEPAKVTPLVTQELTGMAEGMEGTLTLVEYAPGGADAQHRHKAYAFVYVLEGTVVMQVQGGEEKTLGPGQTFSEKPNDVHTVARNASATRSARFLAFFVKEKGAPIVMPMAGGTSRD